MRAQAANDTLTYPGTTSSPGESGGFGILNKSPITRYRPGCFP